MKKILALVMALMMLVCATACAEAAYTYTEYTYDESLFAEIGGEFVQIADFGLMFYLPDIYLTAELPEVLAEAGVIAAFTTEDSSSVLTIAYGPALNTAGAAAANVEELAAYYTSVGATNVDVIIVNGIPVVTSLVSETDIVSYSIFFADSTQCILSFTPASDTNTALIAGLTASSLMVVE